MNFDVEINRYNSNSLKYDFKSYYNKPDDIFPMWIADMDFKCCDAILKGLSKKVKHGIFGYSKIDDSYYQAVEKWYKRNFNTQLKQEWLVTTPGVIFSLATAVKTVTEQGDYVIVTTPVYHPFIDVIEKNKRNYINSELILENNHYSIDFEDFEEKIKQYNVKLFLLCSPHNPVGRVWTKDELNKIIEICRKYNVFIVCDEIHSDFTWNNNHTCLLNYEDYHDNMIVCTAPSKTFNLSGLQVSNIFIPNEKIRQEFEKQASITGYGSINIMGLVACQSAYEYGQKWFDELKKYLLRNINYVDMFLKEHLPKIKLIYPEGTYLLWLDFNELNLPESKVEEILNNDAKLWLNNGSTFGEKGTGFQRLNIALPMKNLKKALNNLEKAFKNY